MSATTGKWRVGDAGHTVFGPPNGKPSPEVIATGIKPDNARFIVRACNSHNDLLAAVRIELAALIEVRDTGATILSRDARITRLSLALKSVQS